MDMVCHQKNEILQDQLFEQLLAYGCFDNADQSKYSLILIGLNTQQTLGNEQYPKTITNANSILSNHKVNSVKTGNKHQNKNTNKYQKQE
jgi:hypothetical protein